jgi:hypothetical protein
VPIGTGTGARGPETTYRHHIEQSVWVYPERTKGEVISFNGTPVQTIDDSRTTAASTYTTDPITVEGVAP